CDSLCPVSGRPRRDCRLAKLTTLVSWLLAPARDFHSFGILVCTKRTIDRKSVIPFARRSVRLSLAARLVSARDAAHKRISYSSRKLASSYPVAFARHRPDPTTCLDRRYRRGINDGRETPKTSTPTRSVKSATHQSFLDD